MRGSIGWGVDRVAGRLRGPSSQHANPVTKMHRFDAYQRVFFFFFVFVSLFLEREALSSLEDFDDWTSYAIELQRNLNRLFRSLDSTCSPLS